MGPRRVDLTLIYFQTVAGLYTARPERLGEDVRTPSRRDAGFLYAVLVIR